MNGKRKGTRNEHRSMALLERAGYRCTRSAASLGEWDYRRRGLNRHRAGSSENARLAGYGRNGNIEAVSGARSASTNRPETFASRTSLLPDGEFVVALRVKGPESLRCCSR